MFDPDNPRDIGRLRQAMEYSRRELKAFREERHDSIRQYAGHHYGGNAANDRVPINLIELLVNIFSRQLAANNPQVYISTELEHLLPQAATMEIRINRMIEEIKLVRTLRQVVKDALFSIGIIKVGMPIDPRANGIDPKPDHPYVRTVSLDDWVMDMAANSWDDMDFMGHRYRLPLERVQNSKYYKNTDKLSPDDRKVTNEDGDPRDAEISVGDEIGRSEYRDYIELYDMWIPEENLLVTFQTEGSDRPLRYETWEGPEGGPFKILAFDDVPGQLMPLSPVMTGKDLHEFVNIISRKTMRQAERQKENPAYTPSAAEDAERIKNASDGEWVRVDNPAAINVIKSGGADPQGIAVGINAQTQFNKMMGNLDSIGGLAPSAETLGQEEMLTGASSKRVAEMQARFAEFTGELVETLAWYEWTNPLRDEMVSRPIAGTSITVHDRWSPDTREGDFVQHDIHIEPFSMQDQGPAVKLNKVLQAINQMFGPYLQHIQQQGGTVRWDKLVEMYAKFANVPELAQIIDFSQPPIPQEQAGSEQPQVNPAPKPSTANRGNARATRSSSDGEAQLMQSLLSGGTGLGGGN